MLPHVEVLVFNSTGATTETVTVTVPASVRRLEWHIHQSALNIMWTDTLEELLIYFDRPYDMTQVYDFLSHRAVHQLRAFHLIEKKIAAPVYNLPLPAMPNLVELTVPVLQYIQDWPLLTRLRTREILDQSPIMTLQSLACEGFIPWDFDMLPYLVELECSDMHMPAPEQPLLSIQKLVLHASEFDTNFRSWLDQVPFCQSLVLILDPGFRVFAGKNVWHEIMTALQERSQHIPLEELVIDNQDGHALLLADHMKQTLGQLALKRFEFKSTRPLRIHWPEHEFEQVKIPAMLTNGADTIRTKSLYIQPGLFQDIQLPRGAKEYHIQDRVVFGAPYYIQAPQDVSEIYHSNPSLLYPRRPNGSFVPAVRDEQQLPTVLLHPKIPQLAKNRADKIRFVSLFFNLGHKVMQSGEHQSIKEWSVLINNSSFNKNIVITPNDGKDRVWQLQRFQERFHRLVQRFQLPAAEVVVSSSGNFMMIQLPNQNDFQAEENVLVLGAVLFCVRKPN